MVLFLMAPLASATPYWFKEGIYAKYVSYSPLDGENVKNRGGMNSILVPWGQNGSITYYCPYVELTWRVLKVADDKAQMMALLRGINCTVKAWKPLDEETARELLRQYQERYNFTSGDCLTVESETRNVTVCEDSYREQTEHHRIILGIAEGRGDLYNESYIPQNFTLEGTFELDLKTGDIYVNGTPVGKNFLWAENPANITGLEILPGLKVEKVKMMNATAITYYGEFNAPVYMAQTNMVAGLAGQGMDVLLYDGSSGLTISLFIPYSPLWRAVGITETSILDTHLQREYEDEIKEGEKIPAIGLILAETNIDFTKPAELPDEGPSKTAIVAVVGIVAVLGALVLWRWRR
ncbi:hypothetical protein [Thermococcus thermotolerans]|uniref:hypothetical protein n=1 Tax=Thermococcus thermotolerans TaxID=2969672 RepID=UPI002157A411|nr:hypothetical protein [Thermococcus thermotolerans]